MCMVVKSQPSESPSAIGEISGSQNFKLAPPLCSNPAAILLFTEPLFSKCYGLRGHVHIHVATHIVESRLTLKPTHPP